MEETIDTKHAYKTIHRNLTKYARLSGKVKSVKCNQGVKNFVCDDKDGGRPKPCDKAEELHRLKKKLLTENQVRRMSFNINSTATFKNMNQDERE